MTHASLLRTAIGALAATLALAAPAQAAPPPNDDLANAGAIPNSLPDIAHGYTTAGATREPGEAEHYPLLAGHTVWLKWTPKVTAGTYVHSCGIGAKYAAFEVYKGPAGATHAQLETVTPDSAGRFPTCDWTSHKFMAVAGQTYYFAIDHAVDTVPEPGEIRIDQDTTKPASSFVSPPLEMGPKDVLSWRADADTKEPWWQCRVDGGPIEYCGKTPKQSFPALKSGWHTFEVRAIDWYGNVEPTFKAHKFQIDADGPDTQITSPPPATASYSAAFTFQAGEPGAKYVCTQDGSKPFPCVSPHAWQSTIWQGEHTFTVAAVDEYGNVDPTPATVTWLHDSTSKPLPAKPPATAMPPVTAAQPVAPTSTPVTTRTPTAAVPSPRAGACPPVVPEVALRRALLAGGLRVGAGPCRATFTLRLGRRVLARAVAPAGSFARLRVRGKAARALRRTPRLTRLTVQVRSTAADGSVERSVRRPQLG